MKRAQITHWMYFLYTSSTCIFVFATGEITFTATYIYIFIQYTLHIDGNQSVSLYN